MSENAGIFALWIFIHCLTVSQKQRTHSLLSIYSSTMACTFNREDPLGGLPPKRKPIADLLSRLVDLFQSIVATSSHRHQRRCTCARIFSPRSLPPQTASAGPTSRRCPAASSSRRRLRSARLPSRRISRRTSTSFEFRVRTRASGSVFAFARAWWRARLRGALLTTLSFLVPSAAVRHPRQRLQRQSERDRAAGHVRASRLPGHASRGSVQPRQVEAMGPA